jgi:hypothetical protein
MAVRKFLFEPSLFNLKRLGGLMRLPRSSKRRPFIEQFDAVTTEGTIRNVIEHEKRIMDMIFGGRAELSDLCFAGSPGTR